MVRRQKSGADVDPFCGGISHAFFSFVILIISICFALGTIIDNCYILTAAHCMKFREASEVAVSVGEHQISDMKDQMGYYPVKSITIHNEYNGEDDQAFDFALLELEKCIDFGDMR